MKKFTLILSALFILFSSNIKGSGVDSLNVTTQYVTVGESWYTDYYTSYSVYNNRSFFKDESGGLHMVFISNYKLNYCFSSDSGNTWTTEAISTDYDGGYKLAVIYADADGNPYIAATVNPHFEYGNPTGVDYSEEFRFDVYFLYMEEEEWMIENVYMSNSSNYGMQVSELYMDQNDDLVLIGNRFGWYTYGGAIYEFTRSEGVWSDLNIIYQYTEGSDNHFTFYTYSVLKSDGSRDLVYSRYSYNIGNPELATIHYDGTTWSDPVELTTDLYRYTSWDLSVGSDENPFLIYYSNEPSPHINMYTDLTASAVELDVDLSLVDTIQSAKIHITEENFLDLIVYPLNSDTAVLYVSEDFGLTWGEPMYMERGIFGGVLPVTEQFSSVGVDFDYMHIKRVSQVEPFGPDSLFYRHIEQINTTSLGITDVGEKEGSFIFYPNPFMNELTIEYDYPVASELNMKIYSLQGKVVMERYYNAVPGRTTLKLNLGDLDAGTYIIEILEEESQQRISKKILKMPVK